jgi:glycerophosphoryl diester phosphodiesterase
MSSARGQPLFIAHRGMPRQARENTLASFALALAADADGIELDVHATADGVVVVHHDETLASGHPIAGLTLEELRARVDDVGHHIPTLTEVCALVRARAELYVEIKGADIEDDVTAVLREYDGRVAIHSFDHACIRRLSVAHTPYRLGILLEQANQSAQSLMRDTGALDVWPEHAIVTRELVDEVHRMNGRVIAWTVNDAAEAERLTALGVDGVCTDDVVALREGGARSPTRP